jgi:hypothetical protein
MVSVSFSETAGVAKAKEKKVKRAKARIKAIKVERRHCLMDESEQATDKLRKSERETIE